MSPSGMSSRERIIVIVLGVVILLALIGIGILAAKLVSGTGDEQVSVDQSATVASQEEGPPVGSAEETPPPAVAGEAETPAVAADITPVAPPVLQEAPPPASDAAEGQLLVRQEGMGGLAPVVIANQALQPGHRYRIEIQAVDGSRVGIHGSWSQAAQRADGTLSAPAIQLFEGQTPYNIDLDAPLAEPARWSCSVSAAVKVEPLATGLGTQLSGPVLAIEILDVTGSQ